MPSIQVTEWLQKGIAAAQAGNVDRAYDLLLKVVDVDEYNEQAWMWLSSVVETDGDREVCLENVLAINPDNKVAKAGLVHLRGKQAQTPPPLELEPRAPEPKLPPFIAGESLEALETDWWDRPETIQPTQSVSAQPTPGQQIIVEPTVQWEEPPALAAEPVFEEEPEVEPDSEKPEPRRRRERSPVPGFVIAVLLLLGVLAAAVAVLAVRQVGPFDPTKSDYARAMRPLLDEYGVWWEGPQGALIDQVTSLCGQKADGWRNLDVLVTCSAHPSVACALLAAHCEADVEAMREDVLDLSRDVQTTGAALLAEFQAVPPPDDIAVAHRRFLACLQTLIDDAGQVGQLARGESLSDPKYAPACQIFSTAEADLLKYVGRQ